jgi:hypothetical protein
MVTTSHEEGTRMIDVDCGCHCIIEDVSVESNSNGTSVKGKLSVLACTDIGQIGKTVSEFFKCDGKAAGMFLNICEAAGIITAAERQAAAAAGVGMNIDETQLKGKQVCCKVVMKPNQRKNPVTGQYETDPEKPGPYPRIGFETFSVWSEKARSIPKDLQFLGMLPAPAGWDVARIQQWATGRAPAQHGQTQQAAQSQPVTQPATQQSPAPVSPPAVSMNW